MTGERILIVEDEPDIARALELNLRAEGYGVLTAATGDDGLKAALRDHPDLVLLDIMLPGMSGLDVCRELRRRNFDRPIIMLTARSAEVDNHILRLRQKLEAHPSDPRHILSVYGEGYKFVR